MTDIATPPGAVLGTADTGKKFVQKPEKPDQIEFEKNLQAAQEEHDKVRLKLVCAGSDSPDCLNSGVLPDNFGMYFVFLTISCDFRMRLRPS